ncbi:MAG TPA: hypothetical protein VM511_02110, partial [Luteolibacter sp.]|nr:hypothetical protein [Luteolibacter sp.]
MSSFNTLVFLTLVAIPVSVCQWIGVIGLRKTGLKTERVLMLIGVLLSTAGMLAQSGHILHYSIARSFYSDWWMELKVIVGAVSALGSLSFAIGFALHGTRNSRITQRTTELEMMNLAQATELER